MYTQNEGVSLSTPSSMTQRKRKDKSSAEQQFHKSDVISFVVLSHTSSASGSYGRQAGVTRNTGRFKKFLSLGFSQSLTKARCYYSVTNAFHRVKYIVRCVMEACESWTPCFFMSIATITVLNDNGIYT